MGSGGAFKSGSADLTNKAKKIMAKALVRASNLLQEKVENVRYEKGTFKGIKGGSIHLLELAEEEELFAEAEYKTDKSTFPSGTHMCEVEIDPDTGKVSLVSYCAVEDTGTVVNPVRLDGQMHGGVAQGAGQTLMEILRYNPESGQLITGSFMDYAMPRATDFPFFKVEHNTNPSPHNPLGIKGGGEGGTVGGLVCVANAIADSLKDKTQKEVPIPATPYEIWKLLNLSD